jgi:tryptophanyl-tRNA synthetase
MSRISMFDDADAIAKKIQRAKTDPHPLPCRDRLASRPEADASASTRRSPTRAVPVLAGSAAASSPAEVALRLAVSRVAPSAQR